MNPMAQARGFTEALVRNTVFPPHLWARINFNLLLDPLDTWISRKANSRYINAKKGYGMRILREVIEDGIFHYDQLERQGMIAIYCQTHKASDTRRYEVVKIRTASAHTWPNGQVTPESEVYPSAKTWGKDGWTFHILQEAKKHYAELGKEISASERRGCGPHTTPVFPGRSVQ